MEKLTIYKSKEYIVKHKVLCSIIFLSMVFIFISIVWGIKVEKQVSIIESNSWPSEKMKNEIKYTQYFKSNVDDLSEIGIKFSTYRKDNKNGSIIINLYDQDDNLIKSSKKNVEDIIDNNIINVEFDIIKNSMNKNYKIEVYFEEYNDDIVLVYWQTNADNNNFLMYNDVKMDASIDLMLTGKMKDNTVLIYPILIILICILWLVII